MKKTIASATPNKATRKVKTEKTKVFFKDGKTTEEKFNEVYDKSDLIFFQRGGKVVFGKLIKRNPKTINVQLSTGSVARVSYEKIIFNKEKYIK